MILFAGILLTLLWGGAAIATDRKTFRLAGSVTGHPHLDKPAYRRLLVKPFYWLLDRARMWERGQSLLAGLHLKLVVLGGSRWTIESTRLFAAFLVGLGYAALTFGCWLSVLSEEKAVLGMGALLAFAIPALMWKDTSSKVERRKQDILLMLPEVLSKLMLLLGAGETVQRGLQKCASVSGGRQPGVLIEELRRANESVRNGESFAAAMEAFSRRCAVQEVSMFTTTLLLNYRRGGDKLTLSLKELSYSLWEKRKSVARSRGEEASSKMVFPLVGIFFILMILVAAPGVMMMGK